MSPIVDQQVSSTMTFMEPWDRKTRGTPFYRSAPSPGFDTINFKWVDDAVTISNARPLRDQFTLDHNGFAYMDDADGLDDEILEAIRECDKETVKAIYYPRIQELVKRATSAKRVIIFDHTLRKRIPALDKRDNADGKEQPATTVHCDQSGKGALRRLRQNLDSQDHYEDAVRNRIQMINVWRPLNGPVVDWPLAQMDYTTLDAENVHACDLWRGQYEERGQTVTIEHNVNQKWWYLEGHRPDEVTLLKIWDSWGHRGIADLCAHAAFQHPNPPPDAAPRESVEVRCLVLYEE
ncbi:methyltransferase [Xylaria grammica]|nr:methyltransferase [Xylaria grammica]